MSEIGYITSSLNDFMIGIILFIVSIFIFYNILSFLFGTKTYRRQYERDLRLLNDQMVSLNESIIPFSIDEFKILSQKAVVKRKSKRSTSYRKGFLSTIFQEPLFSFALKNRHLSHQRILLVKSSSSEYIFNNSGKNVSIQVNGQAFGHIDTSHVLFDVEGKILGQLTVNSAEPYHIIEMNGNKMCYINSTGNDVSHSESDRLFSLFHELSDEKLPEIILLTLYYFFFVKDELI